VMEPPRIRAVYLAGEHGSADGMWSLDAVSRALGPMSEAGQQPTAAGFACEDTLSLAGETIGFPRTSGDQGPQRAGAGS